jgi:N-dimethylarginine dimethylaminohydrolase
MPRSVWVNSETGRLRSVIIGYPDSFVLPAPINHKHTIYHNGHPERPTRDRLRPEFDRLRAALESCGVEVLQPEPVDDVPDQLTPRDIGFVVGDTFVVASMATSCRQDEWRGIGRIIDQIPNVLWAPDSLVLEGGDVVLDGEHLYVGLSERTTREGYAFLRDNFADRYVVEAVPLRQLHHGEDVLHMDCAFLPVGERHALIYPEGFQRVPDSIRDRYEWIEVSRDEQFELATNVLSVSPTTVISRHALKGVNDRLRGAGLEVIELTFDETPKSGGSFRCASLPLKRETPNGA